MAAAALVLAVTAARAESLPATLEPLVRKTCGDCHAGGAAEGGLDLDAVSFDLGAAAVRDHFAVMHDRVAKGQMPPDPADLPETVRKELLATLSAALTATDTAAIEAEGRVPLRRLNRQEYQQTLRDVLGLPLVEVADRLPEDRVRDGFNKSAEGLDFSRIQLAATLDAAEAALAAAIAPGETPQPPDHYGALGTRLFSEGETFGNREAMFFAKDGAALVLNGGQRAALRRTFVQDPAIECCIFRSAYWPYYGYPHGFVARRAGVYRVRVRARAVVQHEGYTITSATEPVPMTFRARRPSGPDVSGDVRAVGGIFDIPPEPAGPHWRLLLDVLADLGDWGQRVGAVLCAEAGRAAPGELLRLVEALPEGALACDLVTAALVVHGHDPVEAVATLGPYVAHVHATDAVAGAFAGRGRATILGTGQVDLPNVLAALEERGYRGWIGLEPVDDHAATAELSDAIAFLRAL
jgi:hypothetical protein